MKHSSVEIGVLKNRVNQITILALGAICALILGACGSSSPDSDKKVTETTTPVAAPQLKIGLIEPVVEGQISPSDTASVQFENPFTVTAVEGKISEVSLVDSSGTPLSGTLSDDKKTWTAKEPLAYGVKYTLKAKAVSPGGDANLSRSFTTVQPALLAETIVTPGPNEELGQGQTINVHFDAPVADKKAAQDSITVTTTPEVEGAFYWVNERRVHWRPEHFWKPGTKVEVVVNTHGKDFGGNVYGGKDNKTSFTISKDIMEADVDDATKTIVVKKNGKVVKKMPTSMGMPGLETPNGIYIVAERLDHMVMDSSTYGVAVDSPMGYRTPVDSATRISYSGIFVHAAPWSMWAQGSTNTSHGCLNVSPADGLWFLQNFRRGDVVRVTGTAGGTLSPVDGLGDWNMDWETWKKGNAGS